MSMNDEQFEEAMKAFDNCFITNMTADLRARDTAQREALARVEAAAKENLADERRVTSFVHTLLAAAKSERDTAQAQLAEAVGLIDQHFNDLGDACCSFESQHDVDTVTRFLDVLQAFLARHAQGVEVTGNSRGPAHAEQQEAQGTQAGDERAAFEAWHRSRFATAWNTGDPTRDMHNGIKAGKYGPEEQQIRWECWQARAALATQPVAPVADHPVVKALLEVAYRADLALKGTDSDGVDSTWDEADRESLEAAIEILDRLPDDQPGFTMEPAAKAAWALRNLNAVRGAEHE